MSELPKGLSEKDFVTHRVDGGNIEYILKPQVRIETHVDETTGIMRVTKTLGIGDSEAEQAAIAVASQYLGDQVVQSVEITTRDGRQVASYYRVTEGEEE